MTSEDDGNLDGASLTRSDVPRDGGYRARPAMAMGDGLACYLACLVIDSETLQALLDKHVPNAGYIKAVGGTYPNPNPLQYI